jgi:large subunit ribosomal protein L22
MNAKLSNLRISPRKVRLVASLVQGKTITDAELLLTYLPKRSSDPILKLIKSAYANATVKGGASEDDMIIKSIRVDQGLTMHRFMPRAFGRPAAIKKRSSHIMLTLGAKPEKKEKISKIKKDMQKSTAEAKTVAKKLSKIDKEEETKEENN